MCLRAHDKGWAQLSISEEARRVIGAELPSSEADSAFVQEVVSYRFMNGNLYWVDIISSITMGKAPFVLTHQPQPLSALSQIQLGDIFGCENQVLLLVASIAGLHYQKAEAVEQGHVNLELFEQLASDIDLQIQTSLSHGFAHSMCTTNIPTDQENNNSLRILITQLYTYMATVYLHLVVRGFQRLDLLSTTILEAMNILQSYAPKRYLPSLVPPLFLIGLAAVPEAWPFFRDIFLYPHVLDPIPHHRTKILSVIEDVWRKRSEPNFAWSDCIELTKNVLLV
jgi:hypothetical protein